MHTKPMEESEGKFTKEGKKPIAKCPKCGKFSVFANTWESDCGGYEDSKFKCSACGYYWWVDGPDS